MVGGVGSWRGLEGLAAGLTVQGFTRWVPQAGGGVPGLRHIASHFLWRKLRGELPPVPLATPRATLCSPLMPSALVFSPVSCTSAISAACKGFCLGFFRQELLSRLIIIIIIKGHSLRRACLQPATNTQNSKPRPPVDYMDE